MKLRAATAGVNQVPIESREVISSAFGALLDQLNSLAVGEPAPARPETIAALQEVDLTTSTDEAAVITPEAPADTGVELGFESTVVEVLEPSDVSELQETQAEQLQDEQQ